MSNIRNADYVATCIINSGDMYRGQCSSIMINLSKKMKKKNYNHLLAIKLWSYAAESWLYSNKEHKSDRFSQDYKMEIGRILRDYYHDQVMEIAGLN